MQSQRQGGRERERGGESRGRTLSILKSSSVHLKLMLDTSLILEFIRGTTCLKMSPRKLKL